MNRKYIFVIVIVVLFVGFGAGLWYFFGLQRERQIQPPQVIDLPILQEQERPIQFPRAAIPLLDQEIEKEFFTPGDLSSTEVIQLYPNAIVPTIGVRPGSSVVQFFDKSERRFIRLDITTKQSEQISPVVQGEVSAVFWSPDLTRAIVIFPPLVTGEHFVAAFWDMRTGHLFNFDSRLLNFVWKDDSTLWAQLVSVDANDFVHISLESGILGEIVLRVPDYLGVVSGLFDVSRKYFVFSGTGVSLATRNIYIYDIQTGTTRQLTQNNKSVLPRWSPDGSWIVFTYIKDKDAAGVEDSWELRAMRKDGTENHSLGILMPAPIFAFLDNSIVAAIVTEKIPEICRDRSLVEFLSQCHAYGDLISLNAIVKTSIANLATASLADESVFGTFGFPRVNDLRYISAGNFLSFVDLRDNKLYAIRIR